MNWIKENKLAVLIILIIAGGLIYFYSSQQTATPTPTPTNNDFVPPVKVMILPVKKSEVLNTWPFGVQGGDHPEGHSGIDFEAPVGADILATANGRISYLGDSGYYDQKTFNVDVGTHIIVYTGSMDVIVLEGQEVKQGDVIARMTPWLGRYDFGGLHFEVQPSSFDSALCPADFFTNEAMAEMEELHASSVYEEREEFPLICNPCPGCR